MDPVTLIATGLAAGAALELTDTASAMVKDACAGLSALVKRRLHGGCRQARGGGRWIAACLIAWGEGASQP
jgi:hypothetical protein